MKAIKTKKRITKTASKEKVEEIKSKIEELETKKSRPDNLAFIIKLIAIVIIGTALFFLVKKYRGTFLAGTVNNRIITRIELNQKMSEQYGQATFDRIVDETIISEQAKANGITVNDQEIDAEIASTKEKLGGEEAFTSALASAGMNQNQYKEMVKLQLQVKKLSEKLFPETVTEEEVKKYFDDNTTSFAGKKYDEVKDQLKDQLVQQKIGQKLAEWFDKIKAEVKINSFI